MANFSQSFTGRGTAVVSPESGALKAQEGLNASILAAEKLRYEVYQKNRSEFLKNAKIDPVFVLSDSARRYMLKRIDWFKTKWGKKAQETNYNFSAEDSMDMETDRNFINAEKDEMLAQYERYKQHRELVQKNPGKFSLIKFAEAENDYMKSGKYTQTMPAWEPLDFGAYARDVAQKQEFVFDERRVGFGDGAWAMESYNMPANTQGRFLVGLLGRNPQADADFFERWDKADKEKWFRLADINKDNKFSPEEQKNAIALWASEEFADVRMSKRGASRNLPPSATTTGFNPKLPVGPDNNKNKDYDIQTNQPYGKFNFKTFVNLSPTETGGRTQPVKSYIDLTTGEEKHPSGSLSFKVVGYSPSDDLIIVNMTQDKAGKPGDYISIGTDIGLKGSEYDDVIRKKFGVYREDLMKESGSQPSTPTGPVTMPVTGGEESIKPKGKLY